MRKDHRLDVSTADILVAVGATALVSVDAYLTPDLSLPQALIPAAGALTLIFRRAYPRAVLVATILSILAYGAVAQPGPVATVPVIVAVFTAINAGHRRFTITVVAPVLLISLAGGLFIDDDRPLRQALQDSILPIGWFVASGVLGEVTRQRRAYIHQVEQRAVQAELTREEAARRRAGEERLRIARDLHDSLTHSISVIKVQAGVAVHLAHKRGENVPQALLAIQEASTAANRELRETLEVLRDNDKPANDNGLARLDELVRRTEAAGVPATVSTLGVRRDLPTEVDKTAYRIVQESLTNIARHAQATTATVQLRYEPGELVLRIEDDGQASLDAPPIPGHGLLGMRERVAALGGRLSAQPIPQGGFAVHANLPTEDQS